MTTKLAGALITITLAMCCFCGEERGLHFGIYRIIGFVFFAIVTLFILVRGDEWFLRKRLGRLVMNKSHRMEK